MRLCNTFWIFVLVCSIIGLTTCLVPPITRCKASDAKCITQSAREIKPYVVDGISEANMDNLDPLYFNFINASTSSLKLLMYNTTMYGQKNCEILSLARDVARSKLLLELECDMKIYGQYEMDGQFTILALQGKGDYYLDAKNYTLKCEFDMKEYTEHDEKKHWKITSWKFNCKVLGNSEIRMENLFNNNKILQTAMTEIFKTNANLLLNEICEPYTEATLKTDVRNYNKFFKYFSVDQLSS